MAKKDMTDTIDIRFENHGTLVTATPETDAGRAWIEEHVQSEGYQWLGRSLAIEHRYAAPIIEGAAADGLRVS